MSQRWNHISKFEVNWAVGNLHICPAVVLKKAAITCTNNCIAWYGAVCTITCENNFMISGMLYIITPLLESFILLSESSCFRKDETISFTSLLCHSSRQLTNYSALGPNFACKAFHCMNICVPRPTVVHSQWRTCDSSLKPWPSAIHMLYLFWNTFFRVVTMQ